MSYLYQSSHLQAVFSLLISPFFFCSDHGFHFGGKFPSTRPLRGGWEGSILIAYVIQSLHTFFVQSLPLRRWELAVGSAAVLKVCGGKKLSLWVTLRSCEMKSFPGTEISLADRRDLGDRDNFRLVWIQLSRLAGKLSLYTLQNARHSGRLYLILRTEQALRLLEVFNIYSKLMFYGATLVPKSVSAIF